MATKDNSSDRNPTSAEAQRAEILRLAQELNLTTLAAQWESLLSRCEAEAPSYTEFTLLLLRTEFLSRQRRKRERMLKHSRLGHSTDLSSFDFSARPRLEPRVVKELLNCEWVRSKRNVICVGGPGKGKTTILNVLGSAAIDEGFTVLYVAHTADMVAELRAARIDGTYKRSFRRYEKPEALLLDEFGYQEFDSQATDDLFRLISARHNKAATVIAAGTGFAAWHRFFPSKNHAVASVDRLVDRATILRFTGKSFRRPLDIHGAELTDDEE